MGSDDSSDKIYTYRGKIHRSANEQLLNDQDIVKRSSSVKNLVAVSGTSVDSEDSNSPINGDFPDAESDEMPNYRILDTAIVNPVLEGRIHNTIGINQPVDTTAINTNTESLDQESSYNFELHPIVAAVLADESSTITTTAVQVHSKQS